MNCMYFYEISNVSQFKRCPNWPSSVMCVVANI